MTRIRWFLILEAVSFIVASLTHSGWLVAGYEHRRAWIAEAVIAALLMGGLAWSWIRPGALRLAGLAAQGLALAGTLIGFFTIMVGIGPRTLPDVIYHIAIVLILVSGLVVAARARSSAQ